jgi:hypothetical protein
MAGSKAFLRNIRYDISAECSICGDTLLTCGLSADNHTCDELHRQLEGVFERHLAEKHTAQKAGV